MLLHSILYKIPCKTNITKDDRCTNKQNWPKFGVAVHKQDLPKFGVVVHDFSSDVEREVHNGIDHVDDSIDCGYVRSDDPGLDIVVRDEYWKEEVTPG